MHIVSSISSFESFEWILKGVTGALKQKLYKGYRIHDFVLIIWGSRLVTALKRITTRIHGNNNYQFTRIRMYVGFKGDSLSTPHCDCRYQIPLGDRP